MTKRYCEKCKHEVDIFNPLGKDVEEKWEYKPYYTLIFYKNGTDAHKKLSEVCQKCFTKFLRFFDISEEDENNYKYI